jgi:hypothetical protein
VKRKRRRRTAYKFVILVAVGLLFVTVITYCKTL